MLRYGFYISGYKKCIDENLLEYGEEEGLTVEAVTYSVVYLCLMFWANSSSTFSCVICFVLQSRE